MIKYGVSELGVIPVRKEPNDRSEMTTQILFGETFQIIAQENQWCFIKISIDDYEGWIDSKNISFISEDIFSKIKEDTGSIITQKLSNLILNAKNEQIILPAGSTLSGFNKADMTFKIGENEYHLSDEINDGKTHIISLAKQFLNSPYLWGGKNPFGIDCSGFVQVLFKIMNIKLPRDASQQINKGQTINFISDVNPGDLAFFDNEEGNITHVGILINSSEIIHASGKVRIDKFDQQGIYNTDLKKYTHKLRLIKRIK